MPTGWEGRSAEKLGGWERVQSGHGTVAVGPPYQMREKLDATSPAWTAMRLLDASIEKADWVRSYSNLAPGRRSL
eukprot:Skav200145  [mRNA]  locus=scaffold2013:209841:210724:+ [translate_table: standard]